MLCPVSNFFHSSALVKSLCVGHVTVVHPECCRCVALMVYLILLLVGASVMFRPCLLVFLYMAFGECVYQFVRSALKHGTSRL